MKTARALLMTLIICFTCLLPFKVQADIGPKPSVVVTFTNSPSEAYYVTLLGENFNYGPYHPDHVSYENKSGSELRAMESFKAHADSQDLFFVGNVSKLDTTDTYTWGYYPPEKFKVAVYFPDSDRVVSTSGLLERYAFHSYYRIDLADALGGENASDQLSASKEFLHGVEIKAFAFRLVLTLALEIALALLLGYRRKRQLLIILIVNLVTQLLLNLFLYRTAGIAEYYFFPPLFIITELLVTVTEAIVYRLTLLRQGRKGEKVGPVVYAILANLLSLLVGLILANQLSVFF